MAQNCIKLDQNLNAADKSTKHTMVKRENAPLQDHHNEPKSYKNVPFT